MAEEEKEVDIKEVSEQGKKGKKAKKQKKKWSKRKKIIVGLVVLFFLIMVFGGSDSEDNGSVKEIKTEEGEAKENTEESEKTEETNVSNDITIEQKVLVDQDGIVITALEYTKDSFLGDGIKLQIENNSNVDVSVGCDALIVNDYMVTDLFATQVAAGKKVNTTMELLSSGLGAAGIDTVGKVEVVFSVHNSDTWDDIFKSDMITIKTSAYDTMDIKPNDSGKELYNKDGIKIVGKTVDEDSFWGSGILVYIENNYGKNIIVQCDDVSINGYMFTPVFSSDVYDGKKAIDEITIFSTQLEENGIESIDDVELKFRIINLDSYNTITETDIIKFSTK